MSADARARALSALARFQVTGATVGETLDRIAHIAHEAVEPAAIVGMMGTDSVLWMPCRQHATTNSGYSSAKLSA